MADKREIVPAGQLLVGGDEAVPHEPATENLPDLPETDAEAQAIDPSGQEAWLFWNKQIRSALLHENRFRQEALQAETLYFGPDNDPGKSSTGPDDDVSRQNRIDDKTALIHGTVDVLRPLIYSDTPQPVVRRRFRGDGKSADATALMAAEAGQRLAQFIVDETDFDTAMESARDDWLIAGRGSARVRYGADFETVTINHPLTGEPVAVEIKTDETVEMVYAPWRRTLFAPSPSWRACPWMAFETPMTRSEFETRFHEIDTDRVAFNQRGLADSPRGLSDDDQDQSPAGQNETETGARTASPFDTVNVWEIWDSTSGEVIWWTADHTDNVLDRDADTLQLEKFYPTPAPLVATSKGQTLTPRPDIRYYERRADEVDIATKKLKSILNAISVSGLFPGTMQDEINKILGGDNKMIAVKDWTSLMEKGGTNNIIQWLPLEAMIAAINALLLMRASAKDAMFEASGVSDVMRAQGDPNETATAQQIKGRYAGLRLSERQRRMAIFARDCIKLSLEVALEHFDTKTIAEITGLEIPMTEAERQQIAMQAQAMQAQFEQAMQQYQQLQQMAQAAQQQGLEVGPLPPAPEQPELPDVPETSWELVHGRLRDDFKRKITVTIETQSTVLADEQADKEARVEFLSAFSTFVQQSMPLVQTGAFDLKLVKEILLFGVRGFPKSRTLETLIASMPDDMEEQGQAEDAAVTVAKIKGEVDKLLKDMDMKDSEADRAHELKLKGVDLVEKSAEIQAEAGKEPPPRPAGAA